jgi:protocatechuate 3,4-dioxygenase beta subunit
LLVDNAPTINQMSPSMTRRRALAGLGTVTLGSLLAACGGDDGDDPRTPVATTDGATATIEPRSTPSDTADLFDDTSACTLTAEQTEGPYYFDADSIRSDIREDREGTSLRLAIRVREAGECTPLADAVVDIWHCDASGVYSGFDEGEGERFLRGAQVTNADGIVQFRTIYPGWYPGRTPHIHVKVHVDRATVLTTQLYFDEETSERVYAEPPYRQGRDQTNTSDGIFDESLVLALSQADDGILGAISFDVRAG